MSCSDLHRGVSTEHAKLRQSIADEDERCLQLAHREIAISAYRGGLEPRTPIFPMYCAS